MNAASSPPTYRPIIRAVPVIVMVYLLTAGATYSGILLPEARWLSLAFVGLLVIGWLLLRRQRRWRWHATPLAGALIVWAAAFTLSLLLNLEAWRRISIGLWYMGAYLAGWFVLHDALANGAVRRATLVNLVLIVGAVQVVIALTQMRGWLVDALPQIVTGALGFYLPRPVGTMGNPNTLAAFMVVVIPLALGRAWFARRAGRLAFGLYAVLALLVLFTTFSRGGWLGGAAGLIALAALLLAGTSRARLRAWWGAQPIAARGGLIAAALVLAAGTLIAAAILLQSFSQAGRTIDLRTWLYDTALTLFAEQPLAGHGVFTFGAGLARLNSTPPAQPHSHAHNIPLNVAAELGIVGLAALVLTVVQAARAVRANLRAASGADRMLIAASSAAVTGFAVHHLLDLPAMMPAIFLLGWLALAAATAPRDPQPIRSRWRRGLALIPIAWLILLVGGAWRSAVYGQYVAALSVGARADESPAAARLVRAAQRLDAVIAADPALGPLHHQQGLLYGLAAAEGETSALAPAIEAWAQWVALEPGYAFGWANLAALYAETGAFERAQAAAGQAVALAPDEPVFAYNLGRYAEQARDLAAAQAAYAAALHLVYADLALLPEWDDSPLRGSIAVAPDDLSPSGQVIARLVAGDVAGARDLWISSPARNVPASAHAILDLWFALEDGDREAAGAALEKSRAWVITVQERGWPLLGEALLARADGDQAGYAEGLTAARAASRVAPLEPDWIYAGHILNIQYLHAAIPRELLLQVGYEASTPGLLALLAWLEG
jgi:putative inorganic carbon (HCO3(-)) transporter